MSAQIKPSKNLRISIRSKLIGIVSLILATAAAIIVTFATHLFSEDNTARVQETNLETATLLSEQVRTTLASLTTKIKFLGVTLSQKELESSRALLQKPFLENDKEFLAESVFDVTGSSAVLLGQTLQSQNLASADLKDTDLVSKHQSISIDLLKQASEHFESHVFKNTIPVITLSMPLTLSESGSVLTALIATFKTDQLLKAVESQGIVTSFLVDSKGFLVAHPDQQRILRHENVAHLEVVKTLLSGKTNNGQTLFIDPSNQVSYLGAFKTIGFAGLGVVSQVEEAKAFEAAKKVQLTSTLITGIVFIFSFLIVYFFGLSLTRPVLELSDATDLIADGKYDEAVAFSSGKRASRAFFEDEIGDLSRAFGNMAVGLAEREKIKNAFSKFHSKDIADKILSGDLALVGERKKVTMFFSDIRSFTSISEKLQPEQVVELVNSYMTRMVRIIFAHGGVVDKYIGDAIMAVYGTPINHSDDSLRAVSAAIRMRTELVRFNEDQMRMGKPPIAIGMGMHTGAVVAGNIGSPERMEYTVLGDNVNLTSRLESLTKEFKSDILISTETYHEIKDYIDCEACGTTKVKGKAEEVAIYRVLGFKEGYAYLPPENTGTGETAVSAPLRVEAFGNRLESHKAPQAPTPYVEKMPPPLSFAAPADAKIEIAPPAFEMPVAVNEAPSLVDGGAELEIPILSASEKTHTFTRLELNKVEAAPTALHATAPAATPPPLDVPVSIQVESTPLEIEKIAMPSSPPAFKEPPKLTTNQSTPPAFDATAFVMPVLEEAPAVPDAIVPTHSGKKSA